MWATRDILPERISDQEWQLIDDQTGDIVATAYRTGECWWASLSAKLCGGCVNFLDVQGDDPQSALTNVLRHNAELLDDSLREVNALWHDLEPCFDEPLEDVECELVYVGRKSA